MKEAVFMAVDMGQAMHAPFSETMTKNYLAFECIKHFLQQTLFNEIKSHIGVALFGDDARGGAPHTIIDLDEPKLTSIKEIIRFSELNMTNKIRGGDIFQALKHGLDALDRHVRNKKTKKRLFIFTTGEGKTDCDKEIVGRLSSLINTTDTKVNIITIDFMESYNQETNQIDGIASLNRQQQTNCKHLIKLKQLCSDNLIIIPASIAIELYKQFQKKESNRVAVFRGSLEITAGLSIDVATYTESREEKFIAMKKYDKRGNGKDTPADEDVVKFETQYIYQMGKDIQTLPADQAITAYRYGKHIIPMTDMIKNFSSIFQEKCLEVVGFIEKDKIPRHYFMGTVYRVVPGDNIRSKKTFSAFVYSMLEMEKYAFCKHISRNNKNGVIPKAMILMPFKSSKRECFYMVQVPVSGEIRQYSFNPLIKSNETEQKLVDELIDKMNLMNVDQDNDEAVKVHNLFNPTKQYLYQSLFHKVSHPDQPLPPLDPHIREYISPQVQIMQKTENLMVNIKKAFVLNRNETKKEKQSRKIIWSQLLKEKQTELEQTETNADSGEQVAYWKKFSFDPEPILQLDPESPLESFNSMISYQKKDLVSKAIKEMTQFLENKLEMIDVPDPEKHNKIIIDCLAVLRNGCIREKEESAWDAWLERTIDRFGNVLKLKLKEKGLGFILKNNRDLYKIENNELNMAIVKIEYEDLD